MTDTDMSNGGGEAEDEDLHRGTQTNRLQSTERTANSGRAKTGAFGSPVLLTGCL